MMFLKRISRRLIHVATALFVVTMVSGGEVVVTAMVRVSSGRAGQL